ncbi:serine/threonine-protein kinase MRCK beta-like [Anopheles cruzii]|uniref:serine/threonine-protein kinase MRCK beta-like n=1 Tax=Anopheles cruzii TaxID=68878 RepID=UPI0022EC920E|nr:serine/threonine-protein kinase MRCK beta-like [Anopheles cruzii]
MLAAAAPSVGSAVAAAGAGVGREKCDLLKHFNEQYRGIERTIGAYRLEHDRIRVTLEQLLQQQPESEQRNDCAPEPEAGTVRGTRFGESDYKRVSDEVIRNQQNQLRLIKEEKDTLESLWKSSQRTIRILELEIGEYRRQLKQPKSILSARHQYAAAVQLLEQNLARVRGALDEKITENRHLQQETTSAVERIAALEESVKAHRGEAEALAKVVDELRAASGESRVSLERTMREKADLEALLDEANELAKRHMNRESLALTKVQEALQIADSALEEKSSVQRREQDARAECDFLASTIGQVMEEAARKVEHELAGLRGGYEARLATAEQALGHVRGLLEVQQQRTVHAETRARTVEEKFRSMVQTNQNLDADLRAASKMIIEMELKVEALQKTMAKEKETNRICSARETDLQRLLANNEQLKERWKREMLTVTDELQRKMEAMRRENCKLTAENNQLKDQLLMASSSVGSPSGGGGGGDHATVGASAAAT